MTSGSCPGMMQRVIGVEHLADVEAAVKGRPVSMFS
jgi:hypothetical protein